MDIVGSELLFSDEFEGRLALQWVNDVSQFVLYCLVTHILLEMCVSFLFFLLVEDDGGRIVAGNKMIILAIPVGIHVDRG